MQLQATALAGKTATISTSKGERQKCQLKVMDTGAEAAGGDVYWVDFWGEDALSEEELRQVLRQPVTIEVRRVAAKLFSGRAFLNLSGGAVRLDGRVVQRALRGQGAGQQQPSRAS